MFTMCQFETTLIFLLVDIARCFFPKTRDGTMLETDQIRLAESGGYPLADADCGSEGRSAPPGYPPLFISARSAADLGGYPPWVADYHLYAQLQVSFFIWFVCLGLSEIFRNL